MLRQVEFAPSIIHRGEARAEVDWAFHQVFQLEYHPRNAVSVGTARQPAMAALEHTRLELAGKSTLCAILFVFII